MKSWRGLGLVGAVLSLGLWAGCGDGGGDGAGGSKDAGSEKDRDGSGPDDMNDAEVEAGASDSPDADAGGSPSVDSGCEPKACSDFGYECGTADDGCGGQLDCGNKCPSGTTCGGGGVENMCGCTPKSCEQLSAGGVKVCGMVSNGCGRMIQCGGDDVCGANKTCGGGGVPNQCGCTPNLAACAGKECGTASDGCGNTIQCGADAGMCSANKECSTEQKCTCKADKTAICAGKCGVQQTPDGCSFDCGACATACAAGEGVACTSCSCPAGPAVGTADDEVCLNGACCIPESVVTTCGTAQCGTKINRCGQVVQCGTCGDGKVCTAEAICEDATVAALLGKYAVRSIGFGSAAGMLTRAEGLLLVDITKGSNGKLVMREQGCWSAGYLQSGEVASPPPGMPPATPTPVTETLPAVQKNTMPTIIELDLSKARDLLGPKDWVRGVQPPDQNAGGWRRGWPTFCPVDGSAASSALPGYAPADGGRALGARKPWLSSDCLCPVQEINKRAATVCASMTGTAKAACEAAWCINLTGDQKRACAENWAQNELPFQPGKTSTDADVTDCRVVDDDLDMKPAVSARINSFSVTLRSASVVANLFWGQVDLSGEKKHWGVSQDQVGLESSNVACLPDPFSIGIFLCSTSTGLLCPAYDKTKPIDKDHRVNPVDFFPLEKLQAPPNGWDCQSIYDQRVAIMGNAPTWKGKYPTVTCTMDGSQP